MDVDHRADLFAVGIILFELLTNRRLFLGATDAETVEMVEAAWVLVKVAERVDGEEGGGVLPMHQVLGP